MYGIYDNGQIIAKFITPMSVLSNTPSFSYDSMSLKRSVSRRTAQRWEIRSALMPLTSDANELFTLLCVKGNTEKVAVIVPQNTGARLHRVIKTGGPTASGSINTSTVVMSTQHYIPKGTFIKFSNHDKIYITTTDRDGSGNCGIFPALRLNITNTSVSWQDDVIMQTYIDNTNVIGMIYRDGILMDNGEITFVEAL